MKTVHVTEKTATKRDGALSAAQNYLDSRAIVDRLDGEKGQEGGGEPDKGKAFTQDDVDRIVSDRLARAKATLEKDANAQVEKAVRDKLAEMAITPSDVEELKRLKKMAADKEENDLAAQRRYEEAGKVKDQKHADAISAKDTEIGHLRETIRSGEVERQIVAAASELKANRPSEIAMLLRHTIVADTKAPWTVRVLENGQEPVNPDTNKPFTVTEAVKRYLDANPHHVSTTQGGGSGGAPRTSTTTTGGAKIKRSAIPQMYAEGKDAEVEKAIAEKRIEEDTK